MIKSGWKSIFRTLLKYAKRNERTSIKSFSIIQQIFKKYFDHLIQANVFLDLISCLTEFSLMKGQGPAHDEQVMGSIQLLQSCTKSLVQRAEDESNQRKNLDLHDRSSSFSNLIRINNLPHQPYLNDENGCISEDHFYLSWFPILSGLARVIIESDQDGILVRTHTMETLFECFRNNGHLFDCSYWKAIDRRIISPILDDLIETSALDYNAALLILALRLLVDLMVVHFELLIGSGSELSYDFLQNALDRMIEMMSKSNEKMASTGQICFNQFLLNNTTKIAKVSNLGWLVKRIERSFSCTLPWELVMCDGEQLITSSAVSDALLTSVFKCALKSAKATGKVIHLEDINFEQIIIKCVTHLECVQTASDFCLKLVELDSIYVPFVVNTSSETRSKLLKCFYSSYAVARTFNCNSQLRQAIFKKGWVSQLPNLVKQETVSFQAYIMIMFAILDSTEEAPKILIVELTGLMERCVGFLTDLTKYQRDMISWAPVLVLIFKELLKLHRDSKIYFYLPRFYSFAIKLLQCDNVLLRVSLREFLERVGELIFIDEEWIK